MNWDCCWRCTSCVITLAASGPSSQPRCPAHTNVSQRASNDILRPPFSPLLPPLRPCIPTVASASRNLASHIHLSGLVTPTYCRSDLPAAQRRRIVLRGSNLLSVSTVYDSDFIETVSHSISSQSARHQSTNSPGRREA